MLSNAFDRSIKTALANPFLSTIFLQFLKSLTKDFAYFSRFSILLEGLKAYVRRNHKVASV